MEQLLRPYGIVIDGALEVGLELLLFDGVIREIRAHTGIPEPYVVSPAFVNAHSHLEYRGLQGKLRSKEYWPWIREITEAKRKQTLDEVERDCIQAALENARTGVGLIAEHSDRPFAGAGLNSAGLRGVIFQEVITRFESRGPRERLELARRQARKQLGNTGVFNRAAVHLSPHAYQTVDDETLRGFGASGKPFSMHVGETDLENELTLTGSGAIADTFRALGVAYAPSGKRLVSTLDDLGLVRAGAQFIHCCAINAGEIELLAARRVSIAHCPRSNLRLKCPIAPVREMLDAGIPAGIGLDSPASSGPIDMFDEMRCALRVSLERGRALSAEEVWNMATGLGAESLRFAISDLPGWRIEEGSSVPLIKVAIPDALTAEELIERGEPGRVEQLG